MRVKLRANNPLVVKAARERERILKELGKEVDSKTARVAKLEPVESDDNSEAPTNISVGECFDVALGGYAAYGGSKIVVPSNAVSVYMASSAAAHASFDKWVKDAASLGVHADDQAEVKKGRR